MPEETDLQKIPEVINTKITVEPLKDFDFNFMCSGVMSIEEVT